MTELHKSYCVPKTEADFDALGDLSMWCLNNGVAYCGYTPFWNQNTDGRSEVPVSRFADMIHDRIEPWRLEEVGFRKVGGVYQHDSGLNVFFNDNVIESYINCDGDCVDTYLTTFTELLTLIKFLTPPTK